VSKLPIAFHLIFRLQNDQVIAASVEERRILARTVLECSRDSQLLAFSQADTHLHEVPACDREQAGRLAHSIETRLRWRLRLAVHFAPVYIKPIEDGRHLYNTFRYILRQPERHGLTLDPNREASNLPDLLGLRPLGGYSAGNVRQLLPRVRREELLELFGAPEIQPTDDPLACLVEATLAAAALPSLSGYGAEVNVARRAAIEVANDRLSARELGSLLGVARRTIFLRKTRPADAILVLAIRRQLCLQAQRARTPDTFVEARVA
jgi:hypothetical protein